MKRSPGYPFFIIANNSLNDLCKPLNFIDYLYYNKGVAVASLT